MPKSTTNRRAILRARAKTILKDLSQDIAERQTQCAVTFAQDLLVVLAQLLEVEGYDSLYQPERPIRPHL